MTGQTDILKSKLLLKLIVELFLMGGKKPALKRFKKKKKTSNVFPFPLSHLERHRHFLYDNLRVVAYEIHSHGAADGGHARKKHNMRFNMLS